MENTAPKITEKQKLQLMATRLQDGSTAYDYVKSWQEEDQLWALAGVLSCMNQLGSPRTAIQKQVINDGTYQGAD